MTCFLVFCHGLLSVASSSDKASVSDYNVVWYSPSKDFNGSMPLGNGDIGANVWVDQEGDIHLYISKTDSWGGCGRLLKIGKVRVRCEPALVSPGSAFQQTLDLESGSIEIYTPDKNLRIYIDANHPVIQVSHKSSVPVKLTASIEMWRTQESQYKPYQSDLLASETIRLPNAVIEPDELVKGLENQVGWYHFNTKSQGFDLNAKLQGLSEYLTENPLLHRAFGAIITGTNGKSINDTTLSTKPAESGCISIHVLTQQPTTPEGWLESMQSLIHKTEMIPLDKRWDEHEKWWAAFWDRSWIHVSQGDPMDDQVLAFNQNPLMIGQDQSGKSRFYGKIGRISVFRRALRPEEVTELAKSDRSKPVELEGVAVSLTNVEAGTKLEQVTNHDLSKSVSFECWIQPDHGSFRIIDKMMSGGHDGFLLDLCPDGSLRFMFGVQLRGGATFVSKRDGLPRGAWSHVVVVADGRSSMLQLYVNGTLVDQNLPDGGAAYTVARAYALQRFIDACAGRGAYPIRHNGSLFAVPQRGSTRGVYPAPYLGNGDPDHNAWGPGYWWQNTRIPYLSMCASGDYDLMEPLIRMYTGEIFEICKLRTKKYFGHGGAFFPEVKYFWGAMCSLTYGWTPYEQRKDKLPEPNYAKYIWICGPELSCMLLDYYEYTLDRAFLKGKVLPLAMEVLRFFDQYYKVENGKLVMNPSMAVETWADCTNPMPELAGLHALVKRVLLLDDELAGKDHKAFCRQFSEKLPPLPTRMVEGKAAYAPAEKYSHKKNFENPELYCVFPFRLSSFEQDNRDLALQALEHRWDHGSYSWHQGSLFMANLGLAGQAKQSLVQRARNYDPKSRFPAFWGPTWNTVPDQDHGGVMMRTLQLMILQADPYSRRIFITPAWPKDWNCEFKLNAPYQTTIEGSVVKGKVIKLKVTPESRREDVSIIESAE